MRKLFLFAVLCMICSTSFAQVNEDSKKSYMYCEIVGTCKFMSNKVTVELDFGQFQGLGSDQRLRGEDGKPIVFNSMVDAMNWMGNDGWQFVQAYVVSMGQQNVYHWLLRMDLDRLSPAERSAVLSKFKTKADFKQ